MNIAIVIPSGDMIHADTAASLLQLMMFTMSNTTHEMALINPRSSLVQKGRWMGVKQALEMNADAVLFIDSDQTFPADGLVKLINHRKSFIGAASLTRRPPIEYTAKDATGRRVNVAALTGIHQVASNGFSFCLIHTKLFHKRGEPWFNVEFKDGKWISEDESFCRDVGVNVWIDADLSMDVGHIGTHEYKTNNRHLPQWAVDLLNTDERARR